MATSSSSSHIHKLTTSKLPNSLLFGQKLNPKSSFVRLKKTNHNNNCMKLRVVNEKVVGIDLGTTKSVVATIEGGKPKIITNSRKYNNGFASSQIQPVEVLRKVVDDTSKILNEKVTKAVITVPAHFDDSQRKATKDAGRVAGLEVLDIINDLTAASLAYGFQKCTTPTILMLHVGAATSNVSVLRVGEKLSVLSTSGDASLGGNDFDKTIVDWLAGNFEREEGIDLLNDKQALELLTFAAEKAKMELSSLTQAIISLPSITTTAGGPKHIETTLTRTKFEELCSDLLERLKTMVEKSLRDAELSLTDLNEVILVGGSTRIPAVQELVKKLTGKGHNVAINPDELVALGAAVQGGVLSGNVNKSVLSLGIAASGGVMTRFIHRNTALPAFKIKHFTTSADGQTSVKINVLQGEREFAVDNKLLGSFCLDGIPPAPRGIPKIKVRFDIDANGVLSVAAMDSKTGKKQSIVITGANVLPSDEVQRMVEEAQKFSKEDKKERDMIETKIQAATTISRMEKDLKDLGDMISDRFLVAVEADLRKIKDAIAKDQTQSIKGMLGTARTAIDAY